MKAQRTGPLHSLLLLLLLFPALSGTVLADLPGEFLVRRAFEAEVKTRWDTAVGIASLRLGIYSGEKPRSFHLRQRPDGETPVIKEFRQLDQETQRIPEIPEFMTLRDQGWSDVELRKEAAFRQWPFFVSAYGYVDDLPGFWVRLPVFEIRDGWVRVLTDWEATAFGWLEYEGNSLIEMALLPPDGRVEDLGYLDLQLVASELDVFDIPDGERIAKFTGRLRSLPERLEVVLEGAGERHVFVLRHASAHYGYSWLYDVVAEIGTKDVGRTVYRTKQVQENWVRIEWLGRSGDKSGWVRLRTDGRRNFWVAAPSGD